jgi:hypothetical protein
MMVMQNFAAINMFSNERYQFSVLLQHVSINRTRVLIFCMRPLEIEKSRK